MAIEILPQFDDEGLSYVMDAEELAFEALQAVVPGMDVHFAEGTLDLEDVGGSALTMAWEQFIAIIAAMGDLGELAEKPVSVKSSVERLKTRNNQLAGKRSTTIEIRLAGVGTKQKDYLENELPNKDITIMILSATLAEVNDGEYCPVFFLNGLRWTADIMGETDGLWTAVLTTEIQGSSGDKIMLKKILPYEEEE